MIKSIKRLSINNFKVFEKRSLELNSDNLIVLDGPNGFGKSSFFDAIELLLTGSIRRYVELEKLTIDKRSQKDGCPWLYSKAKAGSWLSIKIELVINGESKFLERAISKEELDRKKGIEGLVIPLYEISNLHSNERNEVYNEIEFLSNILGPNYIRDFELFHYVEQEENTRLLKQKEKDRQQQIAHLFEIGSIQEKISVINSTYNKLGKLCNPQKSSEVKELKKQWDIAQSKIIPEGDKIEFERLVNETEQIWDKKDLVEESEKVEDWLSNNGILSRLKVFVENHKNYKNHLDNQVLEKNLLPPKSLQQRFLTYNNYLDQLDTWKIDSSLYAESREISESLKDVVNAIKLDKIKLSDKLIELLPPTFIVTEYYECIKVLKEKITSVDQFEESLAALVDMRDQFVNVFIKHQEHIKSDEGVCPTCGYDWESLSKLNQSLDQQKLLLETLLEKNNSELSQKIIDFKESYRKPLEEFLTSYLNDNKLTIAFKETALLFTSEQIQWLKNYRELLLHEGIEINDITAKEFQLDVSEQLIKLANRVYEKFKSVDDSKIFPYFENLYKMVFNNNSDAVFSITNELLDLKINYIKQRYAVASSTYAKKCKENYRKAEQEFQEAKIMRSNIKSLKNIYESEKKKYLESIVKEIEILFHIYSGRLMQNYQKGLGVFIENNGSCIAFNESPGQDFDAVFSMSSGQLAALVLSFTLALNKRYAKHNLLLIDDPVQTLDEINVAGFIELLRTEFSERQIIMSTHEERMSAYFRYKYLKFNMVGKRINFMEQSRDLIDIE